MGFQPGDILPPANVRGITHGPEIRPVWHALIVAPQRERTIRNTLRALGVYAFYPSEPRFRIINGKWAEVGEKPIVTQHVYALFRQAPQWDVLKLTRRLITGVYCTGNQPIAIHRDVIRHLQGMTVEMEKMRAAAEEMERARLAALYPRPGDLAVFNPGTALAGIAVNVESIENGEAIFNFLSGGHGRANAASLARCA